MGYKLRREMRDALPPGLLTDGERHVLYEVADSANDDTREAFPGMDELARATHFKPKSIAACLERMAAKGIELRVAICKDKNGKPVYACRGHRTTYLIPWLAEKGSTVVDPSGEKGSTAVDERVDGGSRNPGKGRPPSTPSPQGFSSEKPSSSGAVRDRIATVTGCADDEIEPIIESIRAAAARPIRHLGAYLRSVSDDDLREHLAAVRAGSAKQSAAKRAADLAELRRYVETLPDCQHGTPGGWYPNPDTGDPWFCKLCRDWAADHPDEYTAKVSAHDR